MMIISDVAVRTSDRFLKPWRSIYCGDAYRIVDANGRHLFDVSGDEFAFGDEENCEGKDRDEHAALCEPIEQLFPEADE
jgi:hypothetical protein